MGDNSYYLRLLLSTRGAGVQQIVLPKFEEADRLGRPVKEPAGPAVPLYLVPGVIPHRGKELREPYHEPGIHPGKVTDTTDLMEPSYTLFHYQTPEDKNPDPLWARRTGRLFPKNTRWAEITRSSSRRNWASHTS